MSTNNPFIFAGVSTGFTIEWTTGDITARESANPSTDVFTARGMAEEDFLAQTTGGERCTGEYDYRLLAVFGSHICLREQVRIDCGEPRPLITDKFITIDLALSNLSNSSSLSGRRLRITNLFREADVLNAMLAEPIISRGFQISGETRPQTLDNLIDLLRDGSIPLEVDVRVDDDTLSSFAIFGVDNNRVAVRLGLAGGSNAARPTLTQLGLLLPIPNALTTPLRRANSRTEGFLLSHGIGGARTTNIVITLTSLRG